MYISCSLLHHILKINDKLQNRVLPSFLLVEISSQFQQNLIHWLTISCFNAKSRIKPNKLETLYHPLTLALTLSCPITHHYVIEDLNMLNISLCIQYRGTFLQDFLVILKQTNTIIYLSYRDNTNIHSFITSRREVWGCSSHSEAVLHAQ